MGEGENAMPLTATDQKRGFERIASSGWLSMVAMDQRESLRTMFVQAGADTSDATLVDFKLAVAEALSPHASAILLDRLYGVEAMEAVSPSCGLVVAADRLEQPPGEIVQETAVDTGLVMDRVRTWGAAALKFLVLWRPDDNASERVALVRRFLDLAWSANLLGIVEGVVRPPRSGAAWDREEAILDAARELGALQPDLYKAEVPLGGRGDPDEIRRRSQAITDALPCPWVVLSSGVPIADFPGAVEAACEGGASGFLAGRGIWMDLVGPGDYRARLRDTAIPRLTELRAIVERSARPWWERR
jgi:sulfofructosephosphate aldolase